MSPENRSGGLLITKLTFQRPDLVMETGFEGCSMGRLIAQTLLQRGNLVLVSAHSASGGRLLLPQAIKKLRKFMGALLAKAIFLGHCLLGLRVQPL